jgi:putative protease
VYTGDSRFSLRGKAGNFREEEMRNAVRYARERGVKVYVTVNIFPHNTDLPDVGEHLEMLRDIRPDAVIMSDPGIFAMFRERAPEIDIHISTQANVTNAGAARFWERLGAKRIVLSRELSVEEIGEIRQGTGVELEVFVHGSICLSYSGRCYISSFLASRSANRGECTNSCRWNYVLMEEKRQGEYFPVYEDDRGTYLLSSRDLCMIGHLGLLTEAGIDSFKIEGRMKGINYVGGVVKAYREAVDAIGGPRDRSAEERWIRELSMFSSRGFTTGMFFGRQPDELVGVILEVNGEDAKVGLRNKLDRGDSVEFLSRGLEKKFFKVQYMRDEENLDIDSARNEDIVFLKVPGGVKKNDLLRRARNSRSIKMDGEIANEAIDAQVTEGCL